jgi:hypothetical protein
LGLNVEYYIYVWAFFVQMEVLAVSLSYLIYDLVCCLFDERINLDNTIHHLVSIVGLMATLSYQKVIINHSNNLIISHSHIDNNDWLFRFKLLDIDKITYFSSLQNVFKILDLNINRLTSQSKSLNI